MPVLCQRASYLSSCVCGIALQDHGRVPSCPLGYIILLNLDAFSMQYQPLRPWKQWHSNPLLPLLPWCRVSKLPLLPWRRVPKLRTQLTFVLLNSLLWEDGQIWPSKGNCHQLCRSKMRCGVIYVPVVFLKQTMYSWVTDPQTQWGIECELLTTVVLGTCHLNCGKGYTIENHIYETAVRCVFVF